MFVRAIALRHANYVALSTAAHHTRIDEQIESLIVEHLLLFSVDKHRASVPHITLQDRHPQVLIDAQLLVELMLKHI